MEPQFHMVHTELETGLILIQMANIVHECELFACAERIRNMAGQAHTRAARHLATLRVQDGTEAEHQALREKLERLHKALVS